MNSCAENINNFCYVCGHFVKLGRNSTADKNKRGRFSAEFKYAYEKYFSQSVFCVDWAPKTVCVRCYGLLLKWTKREINEMPFGIPMMWSYPGEHQRSNCYACMNSRFKYTGRTKNKSGKNKATATGYIGVRSAQLPLPHSEAIPIPPRLPSPDCFTIMTTETAFTEASTSHSLYVPEIIQNDEAKPLHQDEMDFLVAHLGLSQRNSEFLASFLKKRNLTQKDVKVTAYRQRQAQFQKFYTINTQNTFSYCINIEGLMIEMDLNYNYNAKDWRLFIDSSKTSLKAVLLHKLNTKPSVPIAYSIDMKECYETMKIILQSIQYDQHKWKICCDIKVINILRGLKGGYPKHMCFICDWDTRYSGDQYTCTSWKNREDVLAINPTLSMLHDALVPIDDIYLPNLHIKLGICKKFVEKVTRRESAFHCLKEIFPKLSEAKLKAGTKYMFFVVISWFLS